MIKDTIAGESFVLQSLKDAELLLQILERATPVVARHVGPEYREVLYTPACRQEFSIAISGAMPEPPAISNSGWLCRAVQTKYPPIGPRNST